MIILNATVVKTVHLNYIIIRIVMRLVTMQIVIGIMRNVFVM